MGVSPRLSQSKANPVTHIELLTQCTHSFKWLDIPLLYSETWLSTLITPMKKFTLTWATIHLPLPSFNSLPCFSFFLSIAFHLPPSLSSPRLSQFHPFLSKSHKVPFFPSAIRHFISPEISIRSLSLLLLLSYLLHYTHIKWWSRWSAGI